MWEGAQRLQRSKCIPARISRWENVQSDKPCVLGVTGGSRSSEVVPSLQQGAYRLEEESANSHQESKLQRAQEALYSNRKENSNPVPRCQLCRLRGTYEGAGSASGPQQLACSSSASHCRPAEDCRLEADWGRSWESEWAPSPCALPSPPPPSPQPL